MKLSRISRTIKTEASGGRVKRISNQNKILSIYIFTCETPKSFDNSLSQSTIVCHIKHKKDKAVSTDYFELNSTRLVAAVAFLNNLILSQAHILKVTSLAITMNAKITEHDW